MEGSLEYRCYICINKYWSVEEETWKAEQLVSRAGNVHYVYFFLIQFSGVWWFFTSIYLQFDPIH